MKADLTETLWLDPHGQLTLSELVQLSDLSEAELRELVEYGALEPTNADASAWLFSADCVVAIRSVCRLRREFDLNMHALALTLRFIDRIRDLETQLRSTRAQLPLRRH